MVNLKAWIFPSPETSHPHLCEEYLTAGVSDEVPIGSCDGQREAGLVAPVVQLIGEQQLSQLVVGFVAVIQKLEGFVEELSEWIE